MAIPVLAVRTSAPMLKTDVSLGSISLNLSMQYQSKSIPGAILDLFEQGQVLLALLITLFSVLIPTLKTAAMPLLADGLLSVPGDSLRRLLHWFVSWSIAEVFIAAAQPVFYGSSGEGYTDSRIEPSTWYFLSHVLMCLTPGLLSPSAAGGIGQQRFASVRRPLRWMGRRQR
ncbi:MAG: hypothetical protein N838_15755 [Thiohalocapsa sp. PB-PSB1]|jgi:hypothetical protein|nr:MAG: hypothetical protein N838_15755 [Thiohalocapsa sp. PB-PSB1]